MLAPILMTVAQLDCLQHLIEAVCEAKPHVKVIYSRYFGVGLDTMLSHIVSIYKLRLREDLGFSEDGVNQLLITLDINSGKIRNIEDLFLHYLEKCDCRLI